MSKENYVDIEKYIKKEDDLALEHYEIDETIEVTLVPYKEISYKYDSGYGAYCCELVTDTDESPDTFKISGNFISQLNIGQTYKAKGKVTLYNRKKQLKVEEIKKVEPKTVRTIKQFLKSLEGMGPFYDVIYEEYGEKSLDIIRTNPLEVKKVAPALYDALVLSWQKQLLEIKDSQEFLTVLMSYGLKSIQAKQFYDIHGELCIEKLKENPYRLINELVGFGFLKCDTIAKNIGFAPDSEIRVSEAILYTLDTCKWTGNTYMTESELIYRTSDVLSIKLPVNDMKKMFKAINEHNTKTIYKIGNLKFEIDREDIILAYDAYIKAKSQTAKDNAKLVIFNIHPDRITEQIEYLRVSGKIIVDKVRNKIYDKKLYMAEDFIAQKLMKIHYHEEKVEDINIISLLNNYLNKNNIELEQMQYQAVLNSASTIGGFSIINGSAGCVDCDTEFFNGYEWKKISEYQYGDKVLQYNKDGSAELVIPTRYLKQPKEYLWHFSTKYGIDQVLSNNHNCILFTPSGILKEEIFSSFKERHIKCENNDRFKTSFLYSGPGIKLNNKDIQLFIAIMTNSTFSNFEKNNVATIKLKERNKLLKLLKLLNHGELDFSLNNDDKTYIFSFDQNSYNETKKNLTELINMLENKKVTTFNDILELNIIIPYNIKTIANEWYNCNENQLNLIKSELFFWHKELKQKGVFITTIKSLADFIQFIFSSRNYKASIEIKENDSYQITVSENNLVGLTSSKRFKTQNTLIEEYKTKDGFEYCFTVPSHMLVLRRNNQIFITGNCGKTFTLNIALKLIEHVYIKKMGYFEPIILAPTGRAAKVAANATKRETSTIHKILKPSKEGNFFYNALNNLPYNCIIVDETSMLDVEIARYLLEAVSVKTKVIFIGDIKQLASVGAGNVLKDIINSKIFKVTTLDVVKRQALDSGIYKNAKRIIKGEMITSEKESGDAYVYKGIENDKVLDKIIKLYARLHEKFTIDNIQVLAPQKSGLLGTNYLNFVLQDKFNHENIGIRILNKQISVTMPSGENGKFELYFKQGDKVIHTENDYNLPWYQLNNGQLEINEEGYKGVSNGETGRIIKIIEQEDENRNRINIIIVKYEEKYILYTNDFSQLDHAYCMTIHKSQGSEWPAVIIPITFSSYNMLERNLIYTGYTRAKKWIGVIGDPEAIEYAIKTEKSSERQTGLKDRLQDYIKSANDIGNVKI